MPDYRQMYYHLMRAICDALNAMDQRHPDEARQILINAQLWTEEVYISSDDDDE